MPICIRDIEARQVFNVPETQLRPMGVSLRVFKIS